MNLERFTEKAQQAVVDSQQTAIRMDQQQVDAEHLALALVEQEDGLIPKILMALGISPGEFAEKLRNELERRPKVYGAAASNVYATRRFNQALLKAEDIAKKQKDEYVSVEHIFLALMEERDGFTAELMRQYGIDTGLFEEALSKIKGNRRVTSQNPEMNYQAL